MSEAQLEQSLREFLATHSPQDVFNLSKELDRQIALADEKRSIRDDLLHEMRCEKAEGEMDIERLKREIAGTNAESKQVNAHIEEIKKNKAADAQLKRQRAQEKKNSAMSSDEVKTLREKLTNQRLTLRGLEEEVEELEKKKPELQSHVVESRALLKQKKETLTAVLNQKDSLSEQREYRMGQLEGMLKAVEDVRADIQRTAELLNSNVPEANNGQTLFDQVLVEKKTLEKQITSYVDTNSQLRQQIRFMQDELDELQGHEHEGMTNVDMERVLNKLKTMIEECETISHGFQKIETDLIGAIDEIEGLVEMKEDAKQDNFLEQKNYDLSCIKGVLYECDVVREKLQRRYFELETLTADAAELQESQRVG